MTKDSLLILLFFYSFTVFGQQSSHLCNDSSNDTYGRFEKSKIECLYKLYLGRIEPIYEMINGREYFPYYFRSVIKPILFFDKNHSSSITISGIKFERVVLDYDDYKDEVIFKDSTRFLNGFPLKVSLNKDNVDGFVFYFNHDTVFFKHIRKGINSNLDLQDGYYEVVYDRWSEYLIKHKSIIQGRNGYDDYLYRPIGYVNIGNGFSKINTKKEFLKLFGDKSREIKKYIKESGINIHKADKEQIKSVLKFYDRLRTRNNQLDEKTSLCFKQFTPCLPENKVL
jgi:hypothetical protein